MIILPSIVALNGQKSPKIGFRGPILRERFFQHLFVLVFIMRNPGAIE